MTADARDVLTPREVAERAGFSYHAILRAIRRGDLHAFEPVPGHYRISMTEYERWLRTPARAAQSPEALRATPRRRPRATAPTSSTPGSISRLNAIEARG
jgi:excisionase family DNA binding protein